MYAAIDNVVELALVTHKPRAASAYAVGHTRCAGACCHDDASNNIQASLTC